MPPTWSKAYKNVKGYGRAKSGLYKAYEKECLVYWHKNLENFKHQFSKELHVNYVFRFPREKLYTKKNTIKELDITNRQKIVEDQVFRLLKLSDAMAFSIYAEKVVSDKEGVRIEIWEKNTGAKP